MVAATTNDAPVGPGTPKLFSPPVVLAATGLVIVLAGSWWVFTQLGSDGSTDASTPTFQSMSMTPVTSLGTVDDVAISPDGRQLAYIRSEAGSYSIWVRQVATGSEVEVVPPQDLPIWRVDFSADGEYVMYRGQDDPDVVAIGSIFRVPALGGEVRRVFRNADSLPSFSPDGQRFAFRRGLPGRGGAALMVADADGSGEQEMAMAEGCVRSPGRQTDHDCSHGVVVGRVGSLSPSTLTRVRATPSRAKFFLLTSPTCCGSQGAKSCLFGIRSGGRRRLPDLAPFCRRGHASAGHKRPE